MKLSHTVGHLVETHIWDLAQRVTSEEEFLSLGRDVLELPDYEIRLALSGNEHALEARKALDLWTKKQSTPEKAYSSLHSALWNNNWRQLARELEQWGQEGKEMFSYC